MSPWDVIGTAYNRTSNSGLHGYSHENPGAMTIEQQHAILDKTYKQLTEFCGKPPRGNVAPWWEASKEGAELMLKYGVEYGLFRLTECHKIPKVGENAEMQ